jgi:hypothetical protein
VLPTWKVVPFGVWIGIAALLTPVSRAQQPPPGLPKAMQLMGMVGVKDNTKGTLSVESGNLRFAHSKITTDLASTSMQDVVTGSDSQRVVGGTLGTMSLFAPYGSGRFLSLFRSKVDSLTIQYRDADGGLHGVIFTTPVGFAETTKDELVAGGAHTSIPTQGDPAPGAPDHSDQKMPADPAVGGKPAKIPASAVTVLMIQSDEIKLPAEFQTALYENLVQQMQKRGGFQHVFILCCWPGARSTAKSETLLVSMQIICIHSSSAKSDKECAFCTHGFHTTVVREFSLATRVRRRNTGSSNSMDRSCSSTRDRFPRRWRSRRAESSSDSSRSYRYIELCLGPPLASPGYSPPCGTRAGLPQSAAMFSRYSLTTSSSLSSEPKVTR